jgi:hypothetical protein
MGMQTKETTLLVGGRGHGTLQELETRGDSLRSGREQTDQEDWKRDESWTSIIGYIAEMSVPGEG